MERGQCGTHAEMTVLKGSAAPLGARTGQKKGASTEQSMTGKTTKNKENYVRTQYPFLFSLFVEKTNKRLKNSCTCHF